nr:MAG: hypothetical protein [Hemigrapsus takanoi nimavirus]
MKYIEARKFLQYHYPVKKVYAHGAILDKANKAPPTGALPSKTFIVSKKDDSEEGFTQEQLLYLINNPKVKKMILSDTNRKGAIWCSKVLPPNDIYFGGNKEILHDIEFESISDTQFYKFVRVENTTSVKKTIYKNSIEPFVQYPFRNKTDRYRYFLSNPAVIDEETAKCYVEKGIMSTYIKTKIPYCNSIILKKREHIKLVDIPDGLIPIDIDSARCCSDKNTFFRI